MLCGTWGTTASHLHYIDQVIGKRHGGSRSTAQDVSVYACMNGLMLPRPGVPRRHPSPNADPTAEELAEITVMAGEMMRLASSPGPRCCRIRTSAPAITPAPREDAPHAGAAARAGAPAAGRRRDARRRGAGRQLCRRDRCPTARFGRRRQPAGAAQHRRRQHRLLPCSKPRPAAASRSGRCCSASPSRCMCSRHLGHQCVGS